ncbi:MAG: tRNA (guanine(46)-N(7))-methyltransferase TrmB [Actinomycetaceae bacterium]|nr:tRNA (guanine(46)-N(7))-methyltransferase TrmB [Actinomycetaceae bacterium]
MARNFDVIMAEHASEYVLDFPRGETETQVAPESRLDPLSHFGRVAPLIVEIGPGSGEQAVAYAQAHPEVNLLAIEAWHVGVARVVAHAVRAGVHNIRIVEADAAQALGVLFAPDTQTPDTQMLLDPLVAADGVTDADVVRAHEVWTFFPDPWRKKRHHKRRLVQPGFATAVAHVLEPGGLWRLATDWDNYAFQIRDVVEASPYFDNVFAGQNPDPTDDDPARGGFAPRWEERTMTRFERRGLDAGRSVHDICAQRVA